MICRRTRYRILGLRLRCQLRRIPRNPTRLPQYQPPDLLPVGAFCLVIMVWLVVMCLLPNAGSLDFCRRMYSYCCLLGSGDHTRSLATSGMYFVPDFRFLIPTAGGFSWWSFALSWWQHGLKVTLPTPFLSPSEVPNAEWISDTRNFHTHPMILRVSNGRPG